MNAIAQAFKKAGYEAPEERLRKAIEAALDTAGTMRFRENALYEAIRHDAEVLWMLFRSVREQVLQKTLEDAAKRRYEAKKVSEIGGGQLCGENQTYAAPSDALTTRGLEGDVYPPKRVDKAIKLAATVLGDEGRKAQAVTREEKKRVARIQGDASLKISHMMLLNTKIEGRAIGDWKAGEASAWAMRNGQQAHFVRLLVTGLQPDMVIRECVNEEVAERCMNRARELIHA